VQAPINGVVKKVYVRNGDQVKSGDPLMQIVKINSLSQKSQYQEVRSPIDGRVFELSKTPGLTVKSNSNQPLVKIVPDYYFDRQGIHRR
jgi:multidrug efflux pump subunit AcrA (membrane-fusion protein)